MSEEVTESDSADSDSYWNDELIDVIRRRRGKSKAISEEERIERIEECLSKGAKIDTVDKNGNTALHLSVKKSYLKIVQFLVRKGAKTDIPNSKNQTALTLAEARENKEILDSLRGLANRGSYLASQQIASTSQATSSTSPTAFTFAYHPNMVKDSQGSSKRKATADNEDSKHGKVQRLRTAEKAEAESSSEKDFHQKTSPFGERKTYAALQGLKNSLHGNIYQLKLLMLFLWRGLQQGYPFRLATEMDKAEKFDDLVFQYKIDTESATSYRFLQAKHKQNETEKITDRDLSDAKDGDFSLQKYFLSYCKMKNDSAFNGSTLKDNIICTNIDFDLGRLESAGFSTESIDGTDVFLDFESTKKNAKRYKFCEISTELRETLKLTADVYRLAKILVEHVCESKKMTLTNDLFKLYHIALAKEVIDVKNNKFFTNFIQGDDLSDRGMNFRNIILKRFSDSLKKDSSKNSVWETMRTKDVQLSSTFGKCIELSTDPTLNSLSEFSKELVNLIQSADDDYLVKVDGAKYRKNSTPGSRKRVFADQINKLAGHVLIMKDEKIKFRPQFFHEVNLPGNLGDLRDSLKNKLGTKYNDLDKYQFKMPTTFKIIDEELLYSKPNLPADEVDSKDIEEFFSKLIFAVNQPNEIELGKLITSELGADNRFNLLNADLIGASFQEEILNWFKEKGKEKGQEGRFYSKEDAQDFFDSTMRKINNLVTPGLSLSYREELKSYGINIEDENKVLKNFLISDPGHGANSALNLITAQDTLPTAIRVHEAIQRLNSYKKRDSLMFLRLSTLQYPAIEKRVILAFDSEYCHHLLVIDCESKRKKDFQDLYSRLCQTTKRNTNKKLILITLEEESPTDGSSVLLKNCCETRGDVSFIHLTKKSQFELMEKEIIFFQGQKQLTSFGKLLDIRGCDNIVMQNFASAIDTNTLLKLIRDENIEVGSDLRGLEDTEKHYRNRRIVQQVIIKDDILKSHLKSDLLAISAADGGSRISLIKGVSKIRFENVDPRSQVLNKLIILDPEQKAEQFNLLCKRSDKNVHLLKIMENKLIWQQSRDNVTTLVKYRDVSENRSSSDFNTAETLNILTDDNLADQNERQKVFIICDSPGMGKSTVFTYVAKKIQENNPEQWVIRIDLNDFTKELNNKELNFQNLVHVRNPNEAGDFFVENLSKLKTYYEKQVLKIMMKNPDKVTLLFDGLDELSTRFTDMIMSLLRWFQKIGIAKLFVTTRPNMRKILEEELGIFSHTMEPFSVEKQREFLVSFWKAGLYRNGVDGRIEQRLKTYARALTRMMVNSIDDWVEELTGIPLMTRMTAEIFQDDKGGNIGEAGIQTCEEFLNAGNDEPEFPEKIRVVDLYRIFIKKKYYIYSTERKRDIITNQAVEDDNKVLSDVFSQKHEKLALHTLFSDENFLDSSGPPVIPLLISTQDIKRINAYLTEIIAGGERTGIIDEVINGKAKFFHRTIAEYFVATFIINNLLTQADYNPNVRKFIIQQILIDSRGQYRVIRAFLNGLLSEESWSDTANIEAWKSDLQECRGDKDETVFHRVIDEGHYEIMKFFLNRFDKHDQFRKHLINLKDNVVGNNLLHVAADGQHWDVLKWLIENEGADVNSSTDQGRTPLHDAALHGHLDIVKWLVDKGAFVDASDCRGKIPLYEAARRGRLDVIKWLTTEKGDIIKVEGTLMVDAAFFGLIELCKWVDAKIVNAEVRVKSRRTALHQAAYGCALDIVKWLITETNVDVNFKDLEGHTVLHIAALSGDLDMVKWLVNSSADVNAKLPNGNTVLYSAAYNKNWDVCKWLILNTCVDDLTGTCGTTVSHEAASSGQWDIVKLLIAHKQADVVVIGLDHRSVLHLAARGKEWDFVNWLVERKIIRDRDYNDGMILYYAASQGKWDIVKRLITEMNVDVNFVSQMGKNVLHLAAEKEEWEIVKWLVEEKGANVNIPAYDGTIVLHSAASSGQFELVKWLVIQRSSDIRSVKSDSKMTVLHCAAASGKIPLVEWLIKEKDADLEATNDKRETVLLHAASQEQWELVKWLVHKKLANVQSKCSKDWAVLHTAAHFRQWDLVRHLANSNDVDVEAETKNGKTVILYAIESGNLEVIEWLVNDKGIDVNSKLKNGKSILHYAVESGYFRVVKWLVAQKSADIKTTDRNGKTLQHVAVAGGQYEILKWLVEEQTADVKARDNDGKTLLHEAAMADALDVIRLLVEFYHLEVTAIDRNHDTALDLYCRKQSRGSKAIIRLLENGACTP